VRIDGQSVHIDSEGTGGLTVDLGPHGLRMSGDVTIVWNGKQAYQGPADSGSPIRLGEGGERGPRR
jgi:hypothetical protein